MCQCTKVGVERLSHLLALNPAFYTPLVLVGLLLYIPSSMDGESYNTQFIRGSSGHTVAWFSIVGVVVWMVVPQQICPLEPVMWPYFEKAFLQTELSEGFRDKTIWVIRVHLKSTIVFLSETEEKTEKTVWTWRERLELCFRLPGAAVARKGKEGFSYGSLEEMWPCWHLISDFWSPEWWENKFLLF